MKKRNERGLTTRYFPISHSGDNEVAVLVRGVSGLVVNAVAGDEAIFPGDNSVGVST